MRRVRWHFRTGHQQSAGSGARRGILIRVMAERGTSNAKFIIPAVLALWLVSTLLTNKNVPGWLKGISGVAMGVAIVGLVAFLFLRQSGWRELARRYPEVPALAADRWRTCRTAVLSRVALDQGGYERSKVRLSFIVRVGSDDQALYVSAICLPAAAAADPPPLERHRAGALFRSRGMGPAHPRSRGAAPTHLRSWLHGALRGDRGRGAKVFVSSRSRCSPRRSRTSRALPRPIRITAP